MEQAFELFTARMGEWWPLATHSISASAATGVRFEGRIGGRVVELAEDGSEFVWAAVIAWDPPHRFALAWHPTPEPVAASVLDVAFEPAPAGTRLVLEHRAAARLRPRVGRRPRPLPPGRHHLTSPDLA
jgi:hypothetical protein